VATVLVGILGIVVGRALLVVIRRHTPVAPITPDEPTVASARIARRGVPMPRLARHVIVPSALVVVATAVLFALAAWRMGISWTLPAALYFVALGVTLSAIDLAASRLPDVIVVPSYAIVTALLALASWHPAGAADWGALARALAGGAVMFAGYLLMLLASPAGMGFGDVKLAGVLGLWLGWFGWVPFLLGWLAAFVVGGLVAVVLLALRRVGIRSGIPFGPWMFLGAFVGIAVGSSPAGLLRFG